MGHEEGHSFSGKQDLGVVLTWFGRPMDQNNPVIELNRIAKVKVNGDLHHHASLKADVIIVKDFLNFWNLHNHFSQGLTLQSGQFRADCRSR